MVSGETEFGKRLSVDFCNHWTRVRGIRELYESKHRRNVKHGASMLGQPSAARRVDELRLKLHGETSRKESLAHALFRPDVSLLPKARRVVQTDVRVDNGLKFALDQRSDHSKDLDASCAMRQACPRVERGRPPLQRLGTSLVEYLKVLEAVLDEADMRWQTLFE